MHNKNDSRRKLLNSIAAGSGAVVAGKTLPEAWTKPIVDSVLLPAHAETSVDSIASTTQAPLPATCGASICQISNLVLENGTFGSLNFDASTSSCSSELSPFVANSNSFLFFDNTVNGLTLNTDSGVGWMNDLPDHYTIGGPVGTSASEYIVMTITRIPDGLQHKVCFDVARALHGGTDPTGYISNIVIS